MKLKSMVVGLPLLLLPQIASAEILSVKGSSANFREKPSESAKIKFSADKFFPVEVIEKKSGWVKVRDFEGDEAWVAERLLSAQDAVVISADKANIRETASTTSDVLFKVERGEVFKIVERKGQWLKVSDARGDGGWVRDDMTWGEDESGDADEDKADKKSDKADKKSDKAEKTSSKGDVEKKVDKILQKTSAGGNSVDVSKDGVKVEGKLPTSLPPALTSPENLEGLCRAYLDEPVKVVEKVVKGEEKKSDKKSEKKADKKAEKKPAAKPAAKPKPKK